MTEHYLQLHSHIHTIKGISSVAARIYAEFGNISNFETFNQMLAYAGLDPSRNELGEENHKGHMVKHGSSYLRQLIMNASDSFTLHNPVIYQYQFKKRNEDKHWRVAQSHVARKLIRIIFYLEKNDVDFNASLLR